MKSGDKVSLNAYKNLKAEIQIIKTAKNARPYDDTTEIPKNKMSEVMKEIRNKYPQACGKMVSEIVKKYVV